MKNTIQNIKSNIKVVYSDNDTLSIIFNSNELLSGVVGEFISNIKELENITQTSIYTRGNSISVKGSSKKNELIKNAITFLSEQFLINGSIEKKDVHSSITKFMISENKTKSNKIKVGYKFGLQFFYSKNGRKFVSNLKNQIIFLDLKSLIQVLQVLSRFQLFYVK